MQSKNKFVACLQTLMRRINCVALVLGMVALLGAAGILCYSVFARYFFHISTDWQDEVSVFLLVGATFFCGAYVQAERGHVGIDVLSSILSSRVNRFRRVLVDVLSLLFCAFFSWKSWTLWHEAFTEGYTTSSSWAPPLWLPYGLMAFGMTLLSLQLALQLISQTDNKP